MVDIEEEIVKCRRHYAYMTAFRAWWKKWVLPTKKTIKDPTKPNDEDVYITYYEDVYNIVMRRTDARNELVELCVKWKS